MISRYDIMTESAQIDTVTKEKYPDSLSIQYNTFTYSTPATIYEIDDTFIKRPYFACAAIYGVTAYDDVLLSINKIPYATAQAPGDEITFPDKKDIGNFMKK